MRLSTACLLASLTLALTAQPKRDLTFGPNGAFRLEISRDSFGERSHGVIRTVNGRNNSYPLPQSTVADYKNLHPGEYGIDLLTEKNYDRQEVIGPQGL